MGSPGASTNSERQKRQFKCSLVTNLTEPKLLKSTTNRPILNACQRTLSRTSRGRQPGCLSRISNSKQETSSTGVVAAATKGIVRAPS